MYKFDPMSEAMKAKQGAVIKITIEPENGEGIEAKKEELADESKQDLAPEGEEKEFDEYMAGEMSDYDKTQTMEGKPKSLGMAARKAMLERMKG